MKTKKLICIVLVLFFQSSFGFCQTKNNDRVLSWLNEFYINYMTEISKMPPNIKKIESLRANNCTQQFLKKLNSGDYDFDPFINAQDFDIKSIKSLSIKQRKENNVYIVSYQPSKNSRAIMIIVNITIEKNKFLITGLK